MASAVRVVVPLKTRCSIRSDMPPRSSGPWRDPVSTQTPTATERTWGIRSVSTRMPLPRTLLRWSSVTGRVGGVGILELLAVGQRRLLAQGHLPGQTHLAVAIDLEDLHQHLVAVG